MHWEFAQSTPTADSLARCVQAHYALGKVAHAEFLRRSFNQVYRIDFDSGLSVVARLSAERPRGEPNGVFEQAALAHWAAQGVAVARCIPTANGQYGVQVPLPEGPRCLMLFDHLQGESATESAEDLRAFAQALAHLHRAGENYRGPASRYELDLHHLLDRPLQGLLQAPTMTDALRPVFAQLGARLRADIDAWGPLTRVLCHGDAHGANHFVVAAPSAKARPTRAANVADAADRTTLSTNATGAPNASSAESVRHPDPATPLAAGGASATSRVAFFDFDDAGPGYLAYELAVYAWALHPRMPDSHWSDKAQGRWRHFIHAYHAARPLSVSDLAALPRFVAVRQIWLLGEYAGRIPVWGTQAMPTDYLRRQAQMLTQWQTLALELPAPPAAAPHNAPPW